MRLFEPETCRFEKDKDAQIVETLSAWLGKIVVFLLRMDAEPHSIPAGENKRKLS
jgi:hypothetical protein